MFVAGASVRKALVDGVSINDSVGAGTGNAVGSPVRASTVWGPYA